MAALASPVLATGQVPRFDRVMTRAPSAHTAILIPVLNEGTRIRGQLAGMAAASLPGDVIVIDGGSSDGSLDSPEIRDGEVVRALLVAVDGPGLSAQLRIGLAFALERGYQQFVTIDGNGKDGYEAIPRFVHRLDAGFDHVQGSRYLPGGEHEHTPRDRELAVRLVHAPLISFAAGFHYTDTTNGFRGYSRKLIEDPRVRPFRSVFQNYNLHYYLAIRAARLGFRVCEVPVRRVYPASGTTPSKIRGWRGKLGILHECLQAAMGRYDPRTRS